MPSLPFYRWFPGDWKADTQLLTLEEKGAYRELLDALWLYGPIADSDLSRARILAVSTRKTRTLWSRLAPFFTVNDGMFDHQKIAMQRQQTAELQEKRRQAGRKGGMASPKANAQANAQAKAEANGKHARDARAGLPDLRIKDLSGFPLSASKPPARATPARAPARGNGGLSEEQRREAERIQAVFDQKREEAKVAPPAEEHVGEVGAAVAAKAKGGNPESGA